MSVRPIPSQPARRRWLAQVAQGVCCLGALAALAPPLAWSASARTARTYAPRLVTLGGAVTEIAYLLGAHEQIVGTDTTSLYPAAALQKPKVGYLRQLSAEGLLALRPDAVIASADAGPPVVLDQLRSAGVAVELVAQDHTWGEVLRKVDAVGRAADRQARASELRQQLELAWQGTQAHVVTHSGPRPRVLFVLSHGASPMVAGQDTAADAVLRLIGADNAMRGFKGYRPMTAEAMASAAPQWILTTTQGLDAHGGEARFWQRPELRLTPAWARRQGGGALVHMDALELLGFGPRLPATVRQLHDRMVRA